VSGTGASRFDSFYSQVKRFRDEWREWIFGEDKKDKESFHILSAEQWTSSYSNKKPDFENMPRFSEKIPQLKDSLQSGLFDILLLILFNVAFFMASYAVFIRYDAR
jgi:ABC-type transport system involved in multi-copper enzyme maturation permease subunit